MRYYIENHTEPNTTVAEWKTAVKKSFGLNYYNDMLLEISEQYATLFWVYELQEQYMYGSSRLGSVQRNLPLVQQVLNSDSLIHYSYTNDSIRNMERGQKRLELSNHLGNVLAVVTDRKLVHCSNDELMWFDAQVVSVTDYYPFGMEIKERTYVAVSASGGSAGSYVYGFNGMERDDELKGSGNSYDFGARIYDSRLGRWMSVDPLFSKFPSHSDYNFATNSPIFLIDPDGRDVEPFYEVKHFRVFGYSLFSWKSYKNNFNSTTGEQFEEAVLSMVDKDKTFLFSEVIFRLVLSDDTYKVQAVPIASGVVANMKKRNLDRYGGYFERGHKGTKDDPHTITLNQNNGYHNNAAVIFEEFFHAAQHDYYTETGQSKSKINKEVEAKVAKAIGGFTSNEKGLTYESDFADKNSSLIEKIQSGQGLSMSEYGKFFGAVNEFAKTVAAVYNLDMADFDVFGLDYLNSLIQIQEPILIISSLNVPEKTETSE